MTRTRPTIPCPWHLKKLAPQFPWDAFFTEAGIPTTSPHGARQVIVAETASDPKMSKTFPEIAKIFAKTPVSVWRDYLTVHLSAYLRRLSAARNSTTPISPSTARCSAARTQQLDRTTRGMHLLDDDIGRGAGQALCRQIFPARGQGQGARRSSPICSRPMRPTSDADLDERSDPAEGAGKAAAIHAARSAIPTSGATIRPMTSRATI